MSKLILCFILVGAVAAGLAASPATTSDSETLFNQKCASCHAKDGSGHTAAASKMTIPDLRSKAMREMSDADMTDSIANGTKHYAYPHAFLHIGLTSEQIGGLVRYIRSLQAEKKPPSTQ